MAELVPFVVPTRSNKTLLVWELSSGPGTKALQKQSLKFCALEVVLLSYECRSPGAGMAEEPLDKLEEESSKMAAVHRPCEEVTDARTVKRNYRILTK
ncbi:RAD52 motif-containing protein 1 [Camelus dromedarius]|uniref:RAD52 motif-containing protein 1 n=1 Tax=Camelus dromedarius TaxID=9838 RepID=A0A5N4D460_CAMDR|nr:RAD52 motif-containing protein 1 [Camelus dromedarius]